MGPGAARRPALLSADKKERHAMHQPGDIRNLSDARSAGAPFVDLSAPAPLPADPRGAAEPAALRFGPPKVVTREHTNNAVRWKQGERLNTLIEDACARFADSDAVVTDGGVLSY